jgi:hypothetical protein
VIENTFIKGFFANGSKDTELNIKDLQPGDYLLGVEIEWNRTLLKEDKQFSISSYGP